MLCDSIAVTDVLRVFKDALLLRLVIMPIMTVYFGIGRRAAKIGAAKPAAPWNNFQEMSVNRL
jgi:hypothetical protein